MTQVCPDLARNLEDEARTLETEARGLESQARALFAKAKIWRDVVAILIEDGRRGRVPSWVDIPTPETGGLEPALEDLKDRPSSLTIARFWEPIIGSLIGCWACGRQRETQRAHIRAHCAGGSMDRPSNFHLLCRDCHLDSEGVHGVAYWRWFAEMRGWIWPLAGGPA